jgi:hypothetical protein
MMHKEIAMQIYMEILNVMPESHIYIERKIISVPAKKIALIMVDKIIDSLSRLNIEILHTGIDFSNLTIELRTNYNLHVINWNEIKNEINNLKY